MESAAPPAPRSALRAELVLAALALLTFALIPIHINTIYSGLPAHPLFLHVPVILIPVAAVAGLILAWRPNLFARHGVWVGALTVVALAATNLTMGAGSALRANLGLDRGGAGFGPGALIARHAHAASILRLLLIAFTAVLIAALVVYRTADGPPLLVRTRASRPLTLLLRLVLATLAVGCAYFVFHTGDLGAKAVWQGRLGHGGSGGGFPGSSGVPGLFGAPGGG